MLEASHQEPGAAGDVFVGVDWGNSHHQLCVVDAAGRVLDQGKLAHDVAGLRLLEERLRRQPRIAGVAVERSEGLLVETLQQAGHRLFCVSPKMSARARERYRLAPTKSDAFDAFVLADSLRHEHRHWRSLSAPSPLLAELRALSRDRERLIFNQRDVENQLRAIVQVYHPGALHLFSSLDRDISLAFLRDYPTPVLAHLGEHGRCGDLTHAGEAEEDVCIGVGRKSFVDPLRDHPQLSVEQLELVDEQLRTERLAGGRPRRGGQQVCPQPLDEQFGLGATGVAMPGAERLHPCRPHTARLQRARFPSADVLLAETGTAPVTRSSGRSRAVRFRYAANKRMRHAIDWWAFVSVRENTWANEAYQQARNRGQQHNRALRGLGARWTRILWRCWTDHTPYDPARHLKSEPAATV